MYTNPQKVAGDETRQLRQAGGVWLKDLREKAGLSQRELAAKVGAEYYTFISQVENGRGRVPPNRYAAWADAVNVPAKLFVQSLMHYYDPVTHKILFSEAPENL